MDWRGDDVAKTRALIHTFVTTFQNKAPELKDVRYDFNRRAFIGRLGESLDRETIQRLAGEGVGRAARAGEATMRRGVLIQSLISSESRERPGILEHVLSRARTLVSQGSLSRSFSRQAQKATFQGGFSVSGLPRAQIRAITGAIAARWKNAPEIVIVENMGDPVVPEVVRMENALQMAGGASGTPRAFIAGNRVYIVASEMRSEKDVVEALFHESLGHFGLRGLYGADLNRILKQIAALRRGDVEAMAKRYGLDMKIEADRLQAAEEVLAHLAQTKPQSSFVQRAIAAIRKWLRENIPGFVKMKLSDGEIIENYILPARQFVEGTAEKRKGRDWLENSAATNTQQPQAKATLDATPASFEAVIGASTDLGNDPQSRPHAPAGVGTRFAQMARSVKGEVKPDDMGFSHQAQTDSAAFKAWFGKSKVTDKSGRPLVVYHGTTADFAEFSEDFFGEGDGHEDWGEGFYFTDRADAAAGYAEGEGGNVMPVFLAINKPATNRVMMSARVQDALDDGMGFTSAREVLEELGYDGIAFKHKDGATEYVAFYPEQVKSAIGNNGAFDLSSRDILFSRTAAPAANVANPANGLTPFRDRMERIADSLIYNFQDRFKPLRDIQKRLQPATEEQDAVLAEELYSGILPHGDFHSDIRATRQQPLGVDTGNSRDWAEDVAEILLLHVNCVARTSGGTEASRSNGGSTHT